jgi:predicted regulator of Ras-like GTPase activity (Roadblock/LC7/MglB family)
MTVSGTPAQPRSPQEFGWLVNNFATSTPGVAHALIVSSDGLPLITSGSMPADLADPLSAMTSGMLSLGHSIANQIGESGCDQIMLKFPTGHFLFMGIGSLAGLAVLVKDGSNLGAVAYRMAQLVDSVGHVLTPQMRDDLRRMSNSAALSRSAGDVK